MKKKQNLISFMEQFGSQAQCFEHLCELKWGAGYNCRRCLHNVAVKGYKWSYRRCQKCGYDESCTAHTLFHKLKFPITSAFLIVYQLSTMKKGMSAREIARQYGIHTETAWFFRRKVQQAMKQNQPLMTGVVQVDETIVGGTRAGARGRTHTDRAMLQVAVEVDLDTEDDRRPPPIRRARAVVIENFSTQALKEGLDKLVSQDAIVVTDEWSAYNRAVQERLHVACKSENGSSMKELHWILLNLKKWLRGIHHHISPQHIQNYLDEFFYRFSHRNQIYKLTSITLQSMVNSPWLPYTSAVAA